MAREEIDILMFMMYGNSNVGAGDTFSTVW